MIELTQCWVEGASLLHPTTSPKHTGFSLGLCPLKAHSQARFIPRLSMCSTGLATQSRGPPAQQLLPGGQAQCQAHIHSR